MAGIGFELKRMFSRKTVSSALSGSMYSIFVTIGPMLFVVAVLIAVEYLFRASHMFGRSKELFAGAVLYAFVFSLLFVSGPAMMLSRYIADKIFKLELSSLLPSLYGSLSVTIFSCGLIGLIFYLLSPIQNYLFRFVSYLLYIELCVIFVMMVYVSAIKVYKVIGYSFLVGCTLSILIILWAFTYKPANIEVYLVTALDVGFAIIMFGIMISLRYYFRGKDSSYFEFLIYFKKHVRLPFVNFSYTLGLYAHNFAFWLFSPLNYFSYGTYLYAPEYDMASFFGMLTILPALVIFVVKMETAVYDHYRTYMHAVLDGTLDDIDEARKNLRSIVYYEIMSLMEMQLIISVLLIVFGIIYLPTLGFSARIVEIFPFLACGYYFSFVMYLVTILLLYFNNQRDALRLNVTFAVCNFVFSLITIWIGEKTYGLGMVVAGLVVMVLGFGYLRKMLSSVDNVIFCNQPLRLESRPGRFESFILKISGKEMDK